MVYRFKNIRTDFGLGNMPEDNIVYSRFDFFLKELWLITDSVHSLLF